MIAHSRVHRVYAAPARYPGIRATYHPSGLGLAVLVLGEALLRIRDRRPERPPVTGPVRAALGALFPLAPEAEPSGPGRRALSVALQVAAVCAGTIVLLLRVAQIPAWNCVYAEDYGVYLVQALQHPWHIFVPYNGYYQLIPRLIGQAAATVPLTDAAVVFAVAGGAIAVGCALFAYHASAGHIRSRLLRVVLGVALVLLPVAPLEVVGNGVNSPWYMMAALFWAILWRPRSRAGMAVAALVAFATAASLPVAVVYVPLLAIRAIALPRLREHAVTAGWLAGLLVQVPAVLASYANHTQRLGSLASPGKVLAYYLNTVVLRALGWHLSWRLESVAGVAGATLLIGGLLAVVLGWAAITQGRTVRVFVLTAVVGGFFYTVVAAAIASYVVSEPSYLGGVSTPNLGNFSFEAGSRYSIVPIFLLDAALIVAVDAFMRHGAPAVGLDTIRPQAVYAVTALGLVLALGWITDFRYVTQRTTNGTWRPVAESMLTRCEHSATGTITVPAWFHSEVALSCSNLRR
jgi:hypothetical protein